MENTEQKNRHSPGNDGKTVVKMAHFRAKKKQQTTKKRESEGKKNRGKNCGTFPGKGWLTFLDS